MNLDIDNIISKFQKNIETVGLAAGTFAFGIDPVIQNVQRLFTDGHIPNIEQVVREAFRGHMGNSMKTGIMLYIGGWLGEELGYSIGKTAKKGSEGFIKGLLLQHVLYYCSHTPVGEVRPEYGSGGSGSRDGGVRGL